MLTEAVDAARAADEGGVLAGHAREVDPGVAAVRLTAENLHQVSLAGEVRSWWQIGHEKSFRVPGSIGNDSASTTA